MRLTVPSRRRAVGTTRSTTGSTTGSTSGSTSGKRTAAAAAVIAGLLTLGACSGSSGSGGGSPGPAGDDDGDQLRLLSLGPVVTWDPQRMATGSDMAVAGRLFMRTLTAFPSGPDAAAQRALVGDLATSTGEADKELRVWTFPLRPGVKWQDGSALTCEDIRYGISRSFAEPFSTEGLNYPLAYLDIPRRPDGTSTYQGPYSGVGQKGFDQAVSCKGQNITFRLTQPAPDFDQVVSLPAFAPVKKSQDGKDDTHAVFSSGPYRLQGRWSPSSGGTFVRNPHWERATDPVRAAQPTSIRYEQGVESQAAAQRVMADAPAHRTALTLDAAPPAVQQHIAGDEALEARSVSVPGAFIDYLAPNLKSPVMSQALVRQALALATNREGYVNALGGPTSADAAYSLIGPALPAYRGSDSTRTAGRGDSARARALLQENRITLPVPVRVAYRSTPTADKAMAALASGWEEAGFAVQLQPVVKDYFGTISDPAQSAKTDVFWANWAPVLPTATTVIPPLFDSRVNLSAAGTGRDYGSFHDARVNAEIDRISRIADPGEQAAAWTALDADLAKRVAYIALAQRRSVFIAGSEVRNLSANEALGGFVDLAAVEVR